MQAKPCGTHLAVLFDVVRRLGFTFFCLLFLVPVQGCATLIAAAISGGDKDAIRTGLEVDAAVAGAVATGVIESSQERRRRPQPTAPLTTSANVTFRASGPSLAPYTIEYVVNLYRPAMDACTEFDEAGGTVYVSFYLPEYGRPEDVRVRGEPAVRPCIYDVIKQMEFPLSTRGSNVSFAHRY